MKKLFFSLIFATSALASIENIDYRTKHTFSLYKKKDGQYLELRNTRVGSGTLKVSLNLRSNIEAYNVKLGISDFKKATETLTLKRTDKKTTLGLGGKEVTLKDAKSMFSLSERDYKQILAGFAESQLAFVLKNVDSETQLKNYNLNVNKSTFSCKESRRYFLCELTSHITGEKRAYSSRYTELKSHLTELKKEMTENIKNNYDIEGYREFLTKAELLVDNIINSSVVKSRKKSSELVKVKKMLVDERIDSYEYTAIRSKSILNFVNILMEELKS